MKKKSIHAVALSCLFVFVFSGICFGYEDPLGLYSTIIPESWIYQRQKSNENLSVFYGDGSYDLLYFENLGSILDQTVELFCDRTLEMYAGAGGLENFAIQLPPQPILVAEKPGIAVAYAYEAGGSKLWEYRIFLLLPNQRAFTLTLGGGGPWIDQEYKVMQEILTHWRWSF